jgi:hypothetical protein
VLIQQRVTILFILWLSLPKGASTLYFAESLYFIHPRWVFFPVRRMQDPNEDTEWNDILRRKGILPPKEVTPEIEDPTPEELEARDYGTTVDDLDALLDDELDEDEEAIMQQMRDQRIGAMKLKASKGSCLKRITRWPLFSDKFGEVKEITAQAWKQEINQAGDDIWVIVHLYDKGVMLSNILNNHFVHLAQKYKHVKFVRGVAKVDFKYSNNTNENSNNPKFLAMCPQLPGQKFTNCVCLQKWNTGHTMDRWRKFRTRAKAWSHRVDASWKNNNWLWLGRRSA